MHKALHIQRVVIVTPSVYGTDNSATLFGMKARGNDARGVAVTIEAKHMCMMMRGVEKQNSTMLTSVMLGEFRENAATRSEFLSLIK